MLHIDIDSMIPNVNLKYPAVFTEKKHCIYPIIKTLCCQSWQALFNNFPHIQTSSMANSNDLQKKWGDMRFEVSFWHL